MIVWPHSFRSALLVIRPRRGLRAPYLQTHSSLIRPEKTLRGGGQEPVPGSLRV